MSFTDGESRNIEIVNISVSCFSLVGALFIIIIYNLFKDIRSTALRLIYSLSIADLGVSLANLLGDAGNESTSTHLGSNSFLCHVQAILKQYFQLSSLFWSIAIAYVLYQGFLQQNEIKEHQYKQILKYNIIISLSLTILPLFTNSYGDTGGFCWINNENSIDHFLRFLTYYLILIVGISFNVYVYYKINEKLQILFTDASEESILIVNTLKRLRLYPLVLIIGSFFGSINAVYEIVAEPSYILKILEVFTNGLMGFLNAIVYGFFTPKVYLKLKTACCITNQNTNEDDNFMQPMINDEIDYEDDDDVSAHLFN